MKNIMLLLLVLLLPGCSSSVQVKTQVQNETFVEQEHAFIGLVNFIRSNSNTKPSLFLEDRMNRMIFEAGLYKECINKDCYLVYSRTKVKIKFDQEYVLIQYTDKSYIKIEDLNKAASIIYS